MFSPHCLEEDSVYIIMSFSLHFLILTNRFNAIGAKLTLSQLLHSATPSICKSNS